VTITVQGVLDPDNADPCFVAGHNTNCSDRPFVKTILFGFFLFSSSGGNCLSGCDVLDISNPSGDPTGTVQMFASLPNALQQICVAVFDQKLNLIAASNLVARSGCSTEALPGVQNISIPVVQGTAQNLGASRATVTAGQAVSTTIRVIGSGTPSLTCSAPAGAPDLSSAGISCGVPASVTIPETGDGFIQLFMQTTARSAANAPKGVLSLPKGSFALAFSVALLLTASRRTVYGQRTRRLLCAGTALVLLSFMASCGGGGQSGSNAVAGTPSGAYQIVVANPNNNGSVTFQPGDGSSQAASTFTFTLTVQ
jgi:hypothetical protein